MANEVVRTNGATVHRQEFGAQELTVVRETAGMAVAAREKAAVEARHIMAMNRPRNIEQSREQLLKACSYPDFAETAWYSRPAGRAKNKQTGQWEETYAEGFSIRFAEEAIRAFGNIYPEMAIVFESEDTRIVRVTVTDLQSNLPYSNEILIKKQVERKKLKDGQVAIGERVNSSGEKVFIVEATDDEILQRVNALRSKSIRTDGLRLIPAWLKEECKRAIFATLDGQVKSDPDAARRKVIDSFAQLGIRVKDLEEYLGHQIERISPKEITELRTLYTAVKDGEVSWVDVIADKEAAKDHGDGQPGSKQAAQDIAEEKLRKIREETAQQQGTATVSEETPSQASQETSAEPPKGQSRGFTFTPGGKR